VTDRLHKDLTGADLHEPKAHTHTEYLEKAGGTMVGDFAAKSDGNMVAPITRPGAPAIGTLRVDNVNKFVEFWDGSVWQKAGTVLQYNTDYRCYLG
jgi:hypothetical protein